MNRFSRARRHRPRLVLRGALGIVGAVVLMAASSARAAAVVPIDLRDAAEAPASAHQPASPPEPTAMPRPTRSPTPAATAEPAPSIGFDISYPQCDGEPYPDPDSFTFAIVGVNRGRVHSANPCLGADGEHPSQLAWAGPDAELYANTGNPGPEISRHWPHGQAAPRDCDTDANPDPDSVACAYVYGWNAAADSYQVALDAFISLGWAEEDAVRLPEPATWWLDVEDANSWRLSDELNVVALQGAVDYLESAGAEEVGFYSTPRLWNRITGGTDRFAAHPSWHAGASDEADALRRCADETAFTGGELRMVQWVKDGVDTNLRCP